MYKQTSVLLLCALVLMSFPSSSYSTMINAGETYLYKIEFQVPIGDYDEIEYRLISGFTGKWQGSFIIYDELSDASGIAGIEIIEPGHYFDTNMDIPLYSSSPWSQGLFDDQISYLFVSPLGSTMSGSVYDFVPYMDFYLFVKARDFQYGDLEPNITTQLVSSPVPEPSTMLLLGSGLLGLIGCGRRRMKK